MTYNIHYGMNSDFSNKGKNSALDATIDYINKYNIDIAMLQEFPHGKYKYGTLLQGARKKYKKYLKKKLNYQYEIREAITRNGNKYTGGKSLIIISRLPIEKQNIVIFPRYMWYERRKALAVKIKLENKYLWVVNTHTYYKRNMINHTDLTTIIAWIKKTIPSKAPLIFGGDLNFDIKGKGTLGKENPLNHYTSGIFKHKKITSLGFKDSYPSCIRDKQYKQPRYRHTFIAKKTKRIDYLFYKNLSCKDYWRGDGKSSDHYPVFTSYII